MSKIKFRELNLRGAKLTQIEQCNTIIAEYQEVGLRLTLRQLYYQLVSRDLLANLPKNYKKLGEAVSDGRLAGLIDWDAIEDRVRRPDIPSEWDNIGDLIDGALDVFRLPRWKGQGTYCEVWVEKDALAGVLHPVTEELHVTLMVNRGYSSQSAMYESAMRFVQRVRRMEKYLNKDGADLHRVEPVIFYLGDHDPSGEDMEEEVLSYNEAVCPDRKDDITVRRNGQVMHLRVFDRAFDFVSEPRECHLSVKVLCHKLGP